MPVFYYHTQNELAKKLSEATNKHGFIYANRGILELTLQKEIAQIGYDIWPTFHTVLGSIAGAIDLHVPLNPDDELDQHTLKLIKQSRAPWCYVKVNNGPRMNTVVGYCSTGAQSPFSMGAIEMAQKGINGATYIPRPL